MLLSRFWYVILSVVLAAAVFMTLLATRMFDRASTRTMGESLAGDSQVVASFLRDDARKRSIALMVAAFDEDIRTNLAKASAAADKSEKVPGEVRDKVRSALRKEFAAVPADQKFDALFAVDQSGRVIAQVGFEEVSGNETFELGGYPVVADALHGWVRDDSWVLGSRIYRIVARPVEHDLSALPAGAIVGARIVDDSFARELSRRTGAAIGFYAHGARVSSGAPEGFDIGLLDTISVDLRGVEGDPVYKEKGVSDVRMVSNTLGVVYARIVGEAWDLGAGYAVARTARVLGSPLGFLKQFDDTDKKSVAIWIPILVALLGSAIGLGLSVIEHTMPLRTFGREAERFAKGENDQLVASKFRGAYRTIATWINDGTDKVAAKGGVPRKAADLEQVLGPMPSKPAMSAFSLPQDGGAVPASGPAHAAPGGPLAGAPPPGPPATTPMIAVAPVVAPAPSPVSAPEPASAAGGPPHSRVKAPMPPPPPVPRPFGLGNAPASGPGNASMNPPIPRSVTSARAEGGVSAAAPEVPRVPSVQDEDDEATVVSHVPSEIMAQFGRDTTRPPAFSDDVPASQDTFEEYLRVRRECGESVDGITLEKFKKTLQRNRDQLIHQHGCKDVKFSVYVKDGRAAIKANPIR